MSGASSFDDLIERAQGAQTPPKLRAVREALAPLIEQGRRALKAFATAEEAAARSRFGGHAGWIRDPRLDAIPGVRGLVLEARRLYAEVVEDGRLALQQAITFAENLGWEDVRDFDINALIAARADALRCARLGLRSAKLHVGSWTRFARKSNGP